MRIRKENIAAPLLGILLSCSVFAGLVLISVNKDRDELRKVLAVTKSNEDRMGEVLLIQVEMIRIARSIMDELSKDSLTQDKLTTLRHLQMQLDKLAERQLFLMETVTSERLPPAPLRIWASKSLRDRYFAERAQLAVLQERIEPIALSAGYLRVALKRNSGQS